MLYLWLDSCWVWPGLLVAFHSQESDPLFVQLSHQFHMQPLDSAVVFEIYLVEKPLDAIIYSRGGYNAASRPD
jgi:hypothetical protein